MNNNYYFKIDIITKNKISYQKNAIFFLIKNIKNTLDKYISENDLSDSEAKDNFLRKKYNTIIDLQEQFRNEVIRILFELVVRENSTYFFNLNFQEYKEYCDHIFNRNIDNYQLLKIKGGNDYRNTHPNYHDRLNISQYDYKSITYIQLFSNQICLDFDKSVHDILSSLHVDFLISQE